MINSISEARITKFKLKSLGVVEKIQCWLAILYLYPDENIQGEGREGGRCVGKRAIIS